MNMKTIGLFISLLLLWAVPVRAQCTVQINQSSSPVLNYQYASGSTMTATLSVSCPSNGDRQRYSVRLASGASQLDLAWRSGVVNLPALTVSPLNVSILMPSPVGCSTVPFTGVYVHTPDFSGSVTQHTWQVPLCIRMNTATALPAQGLYDGAFTLQIERCRLPGSSNNCGTAQVLTPTLTARLEVSVPLSCRVDSVPNLALNYTSGQAQPATAQGQACVLCNQGYVPPSIALTPLSAVQLGLRYELSSTMATGGGACPGIAVQVQALMPGGQWGRCAGSQCSAVGVHQLVVQH